MIILLSVIYAIKNLTMLKKVKTTRITRNLEIMIITQVNIEVRHIAFATCTVERKKIFQL